MHAGLFEFNVMAFSLCNAPSCFQHLMEYVLRDLNWKIGFIYFDDFLVYSHTFDKLTAPPPGIQVFPRCQPQTQG